MCLLRWVQYLPDAIETDSSAFRVPWYAIAFTRRREVFLGRLAMLGFFSENVGEVSAGDLSPVSSDLMKLWVYSYCVRNTLGSGRPCCCCVQGIEPEIPETQASGWVGLHWVSSPALTCRAAPSRSWRQVPRVARRPVRQLSLG